MLNTDIRYDYFRSYPVSLDRIDLNELREILAMNWAPGAAGQAVWPREWQARRWRYSIPPTCGTWTRSTRLPCRCPIRNSSGRGVHWDRLTSNFHRRYQELYSYAQQDQEVRLITLRVAAVGKLPRIAQLDRTGGEGAAASPCWLSARFTWVNGTMLPPTRRTPCPRERKSKVRQYWNRSSPRCWYGPATMPRIDAMGGIELRVNAGRRPHPNPLPG